MPSKQRVTLSYCSLQILFWGMLGPFCGYQTSLMLARGFTAAQTGAFIALGFLAGILTQPLIGRWADRHPRFPLRMIVGGLMVPAIAVHALLILLRPAFWGTAAIFFLLGVLETNAYPLIDALVMQFVNAGVEVPYSLGRGLGALAYACTCMLSGFLARRFGIESVLYVHGIFQILTAVCACAFPAFPRDKLQKGQPQAAQTHSACAILRGNRTFAWMMLGGFFGMVAVMPLSSFLITIIEQRGGDTADLGVATFLMAASELLSAAVFAAMRRRMRCDRIMLVSIVFMMVKPVLHLLAGSLTALILIQPVQMLGYGLFSPASVYFTNETVAPQDRVQGQSLKTTLTNSMGSLVGNLITGVILSAGGPRAMLLVGACSGLIGTVFALISVRFGSRAAQQRSSRA